MSVEQDIARASVAEVDSSLTGGPSQDSPTLEWPIVDLQELLETLGPEERELVILATGGC